MAGYLKKNKKRDRKKDAKNIVLMCDSKGIISGLINEAEELDAKTYIGRQFAQLVIEEDREKALDFLKKAGRDKIVQDFEMFFELDGQTDMLLFTGISLDKSILIIASDRYHVFNELFEEMSRISNEQTNITRELARQKEKTSRIERKRIERDLHDSVSQTIFSARIIAELIPELWEKDQEEAKKQMEKLKVLTRESFMEMRRLLVELRPESFSEEKLDDLLKQLVNSIRLRADIDIKLNIEGSSPPPEAVKEAIYRICQESLNNVVKHSGADKVTVSLQKNPHKTVLLITDNGRGFDIKKISKKKLGLYIMNQRAGAIHSRLDIDSKVGKGTKVSLEYNHKNGLKNE